VVIQTQTKEKGLTEITETKEMTLTATCSCEVYDEETNDSKPAEFCYGDCYTDDLEYYTEAFLNPWLEAKGIMADSPVRIEGSGMGWRRLSGHKDTSARNIIDDLTFDGDWTLMVRYDGSDLSFVRYSHDEPTGASFSVVPVSLDGDTEWE
jgi:hypothetical protein